MENKPYFLLPLLFCLITAASTASLSAALIYQDFEPANGTFDVSEEYGWGFNGAVVGLSEQDEPVHSGLYSWRMVVPQGPPIEAGTGIASQAQTFNINFLPERYDKLSFWIWSDPSQVGNHTVLVKFFDRGRYSKKGAGVWTTAKAKYQEWSKLTISFSNLPRDFDFEHVDKIEFFNYWDVTYYYDDIKVVSSLSSQAPVDKKEKIIVDYKKIKAKQKVSKTVELIGK